MASIKGWALKGVKTWQGREGEGAQGNIYYQGKKVGWYNDSANGGPVDIELNYKELYAQLEADAKIYFTEHPDPLCIQYGLDPDSSIFFCTLLSYMDKEKVYKAQAKKGYPIMAIEDDGYTWKARAAKLGVLIDDIIKQYGFDKNKVQVFTSLEDFNIQ